MCGRYALVDQHILDLIENHRLMGDILEFVRSNRRNVSPTQPVPVAAQLDAEMTLGLMRWDGNAIS